MKTFVVVLSGALGFVSIWIVVPAPRMFVPPLGVAAPEVCPIPVPVSTCT